MPDILHRVGIAATPERVFGALTTLAGLRGWWISTATGEPSAGGVVDFGFCTMRVVAAAPGTLVHWRCVSGPAEWVDTEVTFRLRKEEGQTVVLFKHANWKEPVEFMHHCSTKWATFLLSMRDSLESAGGRPAPHDLKIHPGD